MSGDNNNDNTKPVKKKKKFIFLKVVLIIAAVIAVFAVAGNIAHNRVEKLLLQSSSYPFEFNDGDSKLYITGDFDIYSSFIDDKGKEHGVTWKSSNKCITVSKDGHAQVKRPGTSKNVVLTEKYKWFLFKAERTFDMVVIGTDEQEYSSEDVVTIDSIRNDEYENKIQAHITSEGRLDYLFGDFGNLRVFNDKDAINLLNVYKSELGIPEFVDFYVEKIMTSTEEIDYYIGLKDGDYELSDETIALGVDIKGFNVIKIVNGTKEHSESISNLNVDFSGYYDVLKNYFGTEEVAYTDNGIRTEDSRNYAEVIAVVEGDYFYVADIDIETNEVTNVTDLISGITGRTSVQCYGPDEKGNIITVDGSKQAWQYALWDVDRNIYVTRQNRGSDIPTGFFEKESEYFGIKFTDLLGTQGVSMLLTSATDEFNDKQFNTDIALEAMQSVTYAYDCYLDNYNLLSYDGQGSEIQIKLNYGKENTENMDRRDNAAWVSSPANFFIVGGLNKYMYSPVSEQEVFVHEYTHAVAANYASWGVLGHTVEQNAINEGIADIMGLLMTNTSSWRIFDSYLADGRQYVIRDLADINNPDTYNVFPQYYDDSDIDDYACHELGILLGHVAYLIDQSGEFTREEQEDLWFSVIKFGLTDESTMVTVRKVLLFQAYLLGYDTEHLDCIAYCFDDRHIYDSDYVITTDKYLTEGTIVEADGDDTVETGEKNSLVEGIRERNYLNRYGKSIDTSDDSEYLETTGKAVEGDPILDDTTTNRYLVFYSPTGVFFNGDPIYIYQSEGEEDEESVANQNGLTDEEMSDLIEQKINESSNLKDSLEAANEASSTFEDLLSVLSEEDVSLGLSGGNYINVVYKTVPDIQIDAAEEILTDGETDIKEFGFIMFKSNGNALGEEGVANINFLVKYLMNYYVVNSTAFDLYNSL